MNTNLEFVVLPIDQLTPYEKNARKHKKADIDVIKKSIEEFGFNDPIGIWGKKNIVVEGHGRLLAVQELGWTEVPCIRLDHLTDEQRKAYALAHNRSAELSEWDIDTLDEELRALEQQFDLESLGFGDFLKEDEPLDIQDDEFDEDLFIPETPNSQTGDIYILGRHKLIVGDSTKKETIDALVGDEVIDLLLTDPPYNVDYEGEAGKIDNDDMDDDDFRVFLSKAFKLADSKMRKGASFYIWFAGKKSYWVHGAILDTGWTVRQMPIWNKNSLVLGLSKYQFKHEPCYFGWKDGAPCTFSEDRTLTTVWDFDRPIHSDLHPTMKPLPLFAFLLNNSTKKGDKVLDLFGGSGTTLICCEEADRQCFIAEKLPKYADVIVTRYLTLKGNDNDCYLIRNGEKQPLPDEFLESINPIADSIES